MNPQVMAQPTMNNPYASGPSQPQYQIGPPQMAPAGMPQMMKQPQGQQYPSHPPRGNMMGGGQGGYPVRQTPPPGAGVSLPGGPQGQGMYGGPPSASNPSFPQQRNPSPMGPMPPMPQNPPQRMPYPPHSGMGFDGGPHGGSNLSQQMAGMTLGSSIPQPGAAIHSQPTSTMGGFASNQVRPQGPPPSMQGKGMPLQPHVNGFMPPQQDQPNQLPPSMGSASMSMQSQPGFMNGPMPQPQYPMQPPLGPSQVGQQYQQPMMGGGGYMGPTPGQMAPGSAPAPAAAPRRLDPDQMPNPIQVMEDDQKTRGGVFVTGQKGQVPPLVTTEFVVQDQGFASPRYIRSSVYHVPVTADMQKQTGIPIALSLSPFAIEGEGERPPPITDMGPMGPVRCNRCKAYMCPFMQFIDGGRRFSCVFCKATTEVPAEYFQHLSHTGERIDKYQRAELCLGAYEFIATKEYCKNNTFPKPPAFIFVLDVSYNNVRSGLVSLFCANIKSLLRDLPKDAGMTEVETSPIRVGFITYDHCVHFYNCKASLGAPQMMVVGDVGDMFMPLLDGFLVDPTESAGIIDQLLEQIPAMFKDTRSTETILGPAIQAGMESLKANDCCGKLFVFHSSLPIGEAPGKLKNRDDRKLLGTEKEKTILTPQTQFYNTLGQECVQVGCSVDLFIFNNSYVDLATIGQVARLTGGTVNKYTYFQADIDGQRFQLDLHHAISRPIAFDAVMRVRTSTGVRPVDFFGQFYMSNTTDIELAAIDSDKAVCVEVKHDDKLTDEDTVYVQVAVLYTSCGGQRRLRIVNLACGVATQMADVYRAAELDTIINYLAKSAITKLPELNPRAIREGLVSRCANILACYRRNCASPSSAGQLILPEGLKLLPLYINCLSKSDALSGGSEMMTDDRSWMMQLVLAMDVPSTVGYFYPRLLPLHDLSSSEPEGDAPIKPPKQMRCLIEKLHDNGAYLLENGNYLFLWVGLNVNPEWVLNVFGVQSPAQINIERNVLPVLDNPLSRKVHAIIDLIQSQRPRHMRLTIVRQRDKMEMVFRHFLVEDRGSDASPSYVDFLCHIHKEVRSLLS